MIKLNFRKICIWVFVSIGICSAVFVLYGRFHKTFSNVSGAFVSYQDRTIPVILAETDATREKGLSGTPLLAPNTGMFFIFQKPDNYGFWMKDMAYPLDIVWLDSDFHIVHIAENVKPETYPEVFYASTHAMYVLELNAFDARHYNFVQGAQVQFKRSSF
jgi:uncharacterized membrane protein (UPF0127 family)